METVPAYIQDLEQGWLFPHHLSAQLKAHLKDAQGSSEIEAIETEIRCFDFSMRDGLLHPLIERMEKDVTYAYPNIESFNEGQWNYLEKRLKAAQHPFLTARYAHLLWLKTKHNQYGIVALNAYKSLAELYLDLTETSKRSYHFFFEASACYHHITTRTKYDVPSCKDSLLTWVKLERFPMIYKGKLMDIISRSNVFKPADLSGLTDYMLFCLKNTQYEYREAKSCLEPLLPLAQKENVSQQPIWKMLGENELRHANSRENDQTGMIHHIDYQQAAYYFKLAGEADKFDEATRLYTDQKRRIKLSVVRTEESGEEVQQFYDKINNLADFLLQHHLHDAFLFLATDNTMLIPKEQPVEQALEEMDGSLMYLFTVGVFDENNNSKTLSQEEKVAFHRQRTYQMRLQLCGLLLVERLFYKGIKIGVINSNSLMAYFNQTWLAASLQSVKNGDVEAQYSWMELMGPALYELILQLEAEVRDTTYQPSYILPVDSLSIKIEGAIRDFALLSDIPVTKIYEAETQEMNLGELLEDPDVVNLFDTEDVLLWRMVVTKRGWNIRNNVAHAFYKPVDYSKQKAQLLLLCLFRLSGYKLPMKRNDECQKPTL